MLEAVSCTATCALAPPGRGSPNVIVAVPQYGGFGALAPELTVKLVPRPGETAIWGSVQPLGACTLLTTASNEPAYALSLTSTVAFWPVLVKISAGVSVAS